MYMEDILEEKKSGTKPVKSVQIVVKHEFTGSQSLSDAFIPIIYDNIRKQAEQLDTIDNEEDIA